MSRYVRLAAVAGLFSVAGCDYSGEWLFAGAIDGVPGVVDLGLVEPAIIDNGDDVDAAVIYGEVGPTGTTKLGGVTLTFVGNGSNVCLWADPEIVSWNQSVDALAPDAVYRYPDNIEDDGDLELTAGLSVYYSGSPGETIGDFEVKYEDALGEEVFIELSECSMIGNSIGYANGGGAHAGRGQPEYCSLVATSPGVSYTALLKTWSTPLDDDRLGYGVLLTEGTCTQLRTAVGRPDECMIRGEAVDPMDSTTPGPWYGRDEVPSRPGLAVSGIEGFEGAVHVEEAYCGTVRMSAWCEAEAEAHDCTVEPCLCGDPSDTPSGGGS